MRSPSETLPCPSQLGRAHSMLASKQGQSRAKAGPGTCPLVRLHLLCCHSQSRARRMPAGAPAPSLLTFTKQGQAHARWCACTLSVVIHKAGPGACPLVRLHPLCCRSQSRARRMPAGAPAPSLLSFTVPQGQAHARCRAGLALCGCARGGQGPGGHMLGKSPLRG